MAQETAPVQQVQQTQQTQQTTQFKYGYFSYQQTLESMPGYAVAKRNYEELKAKYEAEMKSLMPSMRSSLMDKEILLQQF